MEGVPRIKMIHFPLKEVYDPVDFGVLKKYISDHYDESPTDYEHEFTELQNLRKNACAPSQDITGLNAMKRYYSQLQLLRGRFPMEEGEACAIAFSWEDVYQKMPVISSDLRFEEMSTLFNIGALHSRLGARESRADSESMKVACTHFQCAAWAFQKIVELAGAHVAWTPDCEPSLLRFKSTLMLAQAQECILEKSILDHRKSAITAKVAQQLVDFNVQCLQQMGLETVISVLSSRRHKDINFLTEWKRTCEMKRSYYQTISYLSMGEAADEGQRYGERLAWYNAATSSLEEAQKTAKDLKDESVMETLQFATDVICGRQANAKKENDLIYTDRVPELSSLPEIRAASLVKGLGFEVTDKEISGPDIFRRLVPMATHAASSIYSEEKAKLLRKMTEEVAEKNAWMEDFLASMSIATAHPVDLPMSQDLLDCCAKLRARTGSVQDSDESSQTSQLTQEATAALRSLVDVSVDVESGFSDLLTNLTEEAEAQSTFASSFPKAGPPPGESELKAVREEAVELQNTESEARTMNAALRSALEREVKNAQRLMKSPAVIIQELPSVKEITEDESSRKILLEVARLLGVVDEMRNQRTKLIDQLRQDLLADDITQQLISAQGVECSDSDRSAVYAQELKKHDKVVEYLRQNMSAQSNVAKKLEEVYVQYAPIKKRLEEVERQRREEMDELCNTFTSYTTALEKASEGITFYERTMKSLTRLSARLQRVVGARKQMRETFMAKFAPPPAPVVKPDAMKAEPANEVVHTPPAAVAKPVAPPNDGIPRLKDFLPTMKPKTYGAESKDKKASSSSPAAAAPFTVPHQGEYPTGYAQGLPSYSSGRSGTPATATTGSSVNSSVAEEIDQNVPVDSSTQMFLPWFQNQQRWCYINQPGQAPVKYSIASQRQTISEPFLSTAGNSVGYSVSYSSRVTPTVGTPSSSGQQSVQQPNQYQHIYQQSYAQNGQQSQTESPRQPPNYASPQQPYHQPHPRFPAQQTPYVPSPQPTTQPQTSQVPQSSSYRPSQPNYAYSQAGYQQPQANPLTGQPYQQPQTWQSPPQPVYSLAAQQPSAGQTTHASYQQPQAGQVSQQTYKANTSQASQAYQQPQAGQTAQTGYQQPQPGQTAQAYQQPQPGQTAQAYQQPQAGQTAQAYQQPQAGQTPQQAYQQPQAGQTAQAYQQPQAGQTPQQAYQQPQAGQTAQAYQQPQAGQTAQAYQQPQGGQTAQAYQPARVVPTSHAGYQQPQGAQKTQTYQQSQAGPAAQPGYQQPQAGQTPQTGYQQSQTGQPQQAGYQQPQAGQTAQAGYQQPQTGQPSSRAGFNSTSYQQHAGQPSSQPYQQVNQFSQQVGYQSQASYSLQDQSKPASQQPSLPQQPQNQQSGYQAQQQGSPNHQQYSQMYQQRFSSPQTYQQPQSYQHFSSPTPQQRLPYSAPQQSTYPTSSGYSYQPQNTFQPATTSADNTNQSSTYYAPPASSWQSPSPHALNGNNSAITQARKDLLSSSPVMPDVSGMNLPVSAAVLTPKVLTKEELEEQHAEETKLRQLAAAASKKDPLDDNLTLNTFIAEVERFFRRISELERYDTGELYNAWKGICDEARGFPKKSMAIGRMYPMKNRFPENVPFDENRVLLKDAKDDYINATHVDIATLECLANSACCPKFIVAQAPLPTTLSDFWTMILEQGCEVVAMLACPAVSEVPAPVRLPPHWPESKGDVKRFGSLEVLVQALKEKEHWTERVLTVRRGGQTRTVVHLQLHNLLGAGGARGGIPASPESLCSFVNEVRALYKQQRSPIKPITVLCGSGAGVSGTVVALYAGMVHVESKGRLPSSLASFVLHLWRQKAGLVEDEEQFLLLHRALAQFANELLVKRNIVVSSGRKVPGRQTSNPGLLKTPFSDLQTSVSALSNREEGEEERTSVEAPVTVEQPKTEASSLNELAATLGDLEISPTPAQRRRITKRDFMESRNTAGTSGTLLSSNIKTDDPSDPFSDLDPMWSLKK